MFSRSQGVPFFVVETVVVVEMGLKKMDEESGIEKGFIYPCTTREGGHFHEVISCLLITKASKQKEKEKLVLCPILCRFALCGFGSLTPFLHA